MPIFIMNINLQGRKSGSIKMFQLQQNYPESENKPQTRGKYLQITFVFQIHKELVLLNKDTTPTYMYFKIVDKNTDKQEPSYTAVKSGKWDATLESSLEFS